MQCCQEFYVKWCYIYIYYFTILWLNNGFISHHGRLPSILPTYIISFGTLYPDDILVVLENFNPDFWCLGSRSVYRGVFSIYILYTPPPSDVSRFLNQKDMALEDRISTILAAISLKILTTPPLIHITKRRKNHE